MMEDEVVRRRRWLSRDAFLDYLGATNLIPGPNSTEMAMHIGRLHAGWPGLILGGAAFILPGAVIVALLAVAYGRLGSLPVVDGLLYGVKPVVIAVVAQAIGRLAPTAIKTSTHAVLALLAVAAIVYGIHELWVLAAIGVLAGAWTGLRARGTRGGRSSASIAGAVLSSGVGLSSSVSAAAGAASSVVAASVATGTAASAVSLPLLFLLFLKIGAVLFGSGYVLIAFLRADFVERLGWLSERQLLDAIVAGQITPGPVSTTATFIGYLLGGWTGAAVATVGIFLPAYVFVALSGPLVPRLRRSAWTSAVLDGVNVASLALMAVVTWQLARVALLDPLTIALAVVALVLLLKYRVNSAWLMLAGALAGYVARG